MLQLKGYSDFKLIYHGTAGGSSIVYRGVREKDGKNVALKIPAKPVSAARKISSLSREYSLLQGHDLGKVPEALDLIHTDPNPVLVLEYFDAPALRDTLSREPMALTLFFSFAIQLVEIVSDIHRKNLIHCDLTPGNILFRPETGMVRLIDFGCALEFPRHARPVVNPTFVEGSPPYMSPEQTGRLNRGLDYRTDFYSLGIIFYRLLTGRMPFVTTDQGELVHCHIAVTPQSPSHVSGGVPEVLSELVLKLLSKDPGNRYQSGEGLRADLSTLSSMGLEQDPDASIDLAKADLKDRFIIPEKLYGRDDEREELIRCYDQTVNGQGQMFFISGQAGIGKTSLIKELYEPLAKRGGYLAAGKFDQYLRSQPYSGLTIAFTHLLQQILTESEESVARWKGSILDALGPNGRLLTNVIPGLEMLIGPQPEVDDLPVMESKTRFSNVFARFIEMLGGAFQPVVIFLDDLQWIDASSLALLERMAGSISTAQMMVIGAYRDNEVTKSHGLAISLAEIRNTTESIVEVALEDLAPESLMELLVDTFHMPKDKLVDLNNILLQKTHGNPLFYKTMLDGYYSDGHLYFDYDKEQWTWDRQAILLTPYADNVIEMLQNRIPSLTGGQSEILGLGACLGSVFELDHLAGVANTPRFEVARDLMAAVRSGLLHPIGSEFELLTEDKDHILPSIKFKFAHDRIQQAAYQLVEEKDKPDLHLRYGRLLHSEIDKGDGGQKLFAAVANLNKGRELIGGNDRQELSCLNLKAGKKAKDAAAFTDAHACLSVAVELLSEDAWETNHQLSLDAHLQLAEACYLINDFDRAETFYGLIREKSLNINNLLTLINIQAKQYHHQGRYGEAIDLELEGLALLGIDLPTGDDELFGLFLEEGKSINELLNGKDIEDLAKQPEVDEPRLILTHEILFDLFADAYLMGRGALLACAAAISTRLSVEYGTCVMSSIGYVNYATCLCAGGQYSTGHSYGRVAVTLADHYQVAALKNYTYHLFALSINHWLEPLGSSYDYWRKASKLALESGSPYAGWVFLQLAHVLLASGAPLDKVELQVEESRAYLISAGLKDIAFMLELIVAQPIRHLRGKTTDITTLDDESFNCTRLMEEYKEALFFLSHIPYSMLRATLIGRKILSKASMSGWMEMFSQTMQGQFIHVDCYFYYTLHLAAGCVELTGEKRNELLKDIDDNLERFSSWAELCPHNFRHKYLLLVAERKKLQGETIEAMDLYDEAIEAAYASEFLQDAALANELAGLFWLGLGKSRLALPYLGQALSVYDRWGATGKVRQLKKEYPALLGVARYEENDEWETTASGTREFSAKLDLNSILKVSQAVSRHMVLDKLAGELVDLAMQNAGATKAVLQLKKEEGFATVKCATVSEAGNAQIVHHETTGQCEVPDLVVNYVLRSGQSLVLDNALRDNRFNRSEYIVSHRLKSVCCVPISIKNEVHGLLYLENSNTMAAFRQDRLQVLMAIVSQAAISLENAKIYQELDELNKNLETKVMDRTRELSEKNHELKILSITDQLTGLFNRHHIEQTIKDEIGRCHRYNQPLSLTLLDIDHFKKVNDTYGHDVGDEVLRSVSRVLQEHIRSSDLAGRWGGEEFLVIFPQADESVGLVIADKLRKALQAYQYERVGEVTASFGLTMLQPGDDVDSLIKRADDALYEAKRAGRNQVAVNVADQKN